MEAKCPQCGKILELGEVKSPRTFKCVCKFSFRFDPKSAAPPKEIKTKIEHASHSPSFEETSDAEEMSENDIDDLLSNLRQSRAEIQKEEVQSQAPVDVSQYMPSELSIDIEERVSNSKPNDPLFEETFEAKLSPEDENWISEARLKNAKQKVVPKDLSFRERAEKLVRSRLAVLSLLSVGLTSVLVGVLFWIFSPSQEKVETDPYLAELLGGDPPPSLPKLKEAKLKTKATTSSAPAVKKTMGEAKSRATRPEGPKLPDIHSMSLEGRYDDIIQFDRARLTGINEEAAFFEAVFLSKSSSSSLRSTTSEELDERWKSTKNSLYARSMAVRLISTKQSLEAIQQLKNLSLTRSRDAFIFAYLGLAYEDLKRPKLALNSYSQAISMESDFVWALERASRIARSIKEFDIALQLASQLAERSKKHASAAYLMRAQIYTSQQKLKLADEEYKKSLRAGESFDAHYALALRLIRSHPTQAERHLSSARNLAQTSYERRKAYFALGQTHCQLKDHRNLSWAFQKAYQEDRNFIAALEEKAKCESQLGLHNSAARTYQSILKTKPQDHQLWLMYGSTLRNTKKQKPAIAAIKRSLELKDTDAAHYELALIYLNLNQRKDASYHAKRAFQLNPQNQKAKKLLASLP